MAKESNFYFEKRIQIRFLKGIEIVLLLSNVPAWGGGWGALISALTRLANLQAELKRSPGITINHETSKISSSSDKSCFGR